MKPTKIANSQNLLDCTSIQKGKKVFSQSSQPKLISRHIQNHLGKHKLSQRLQCALPLITLGGYRSCLITEPLKNSSLHFIIQLPIYRRSTDSLDEILITKTLVKSQKLHSSVSNELFKTFLEYRAIIAIGFKNLRIENFQRRLYGSVGFPGARRAEQDLIQRNLSSSTVGYQALALNGLLLKLLGKRQ